MTKNDIFNTAENLMNDHDIKAICAETANAIGLSDFSFFDAPLIGFAAADDPLFEQFKCPDAVGSHMLLPSQWLEGAKSVVSIFVPFSAQVKKANSTCPKGQVAPEYVYAKNAAVPYLDKLVDTLCRAITAEGFSVVVPSRESDRMKAAVTADDGSRLKFTSGWSERHVAFVCGMGTFGLSKGLITSKGVAGRYISFVTDMPFEADARPYTDPYEYCTFCGACVARCPGEAITKEEGKDKAKCSAFVNSTKEVYTPFYGCAKCQCGVPCANGIPKKA